MLRCCCWDSLVGAAMDAALLRMAGVFASARANAALASLGKYVRAGAAAAAAAAADDRPVEEEPRPCAAEEAGRLCECAPPAAAPPPFFLLLAAPDEYAPLRRCMAWVRGEESRTEEPSQARCAQRLRPALKQVHFGCKRFLGVGCAVWEPQRGRATQCNTLLECRREHAGCVSSHCVVARSLTSLSDRTAPCCSSIPHTRPHPRCSPRCSHKRRAPLMPLPW